MNIEMTTPHDTMVSIGQWVRLMRQRMNWTQSDLATRSGVPAATISRLERTGLASTDALSRVLFALDALDSLQDFLKDRLRLASFPTTADGEQPRLDLRRVRHRKETP